MFFFFGILISKQIAVASLFSFPLRIKTSFRKKYYRWFRIFFMEVECIGNTQIIHMEETGIAQRTIGLMEEKRDKNLSNMSWEYCPSGFVSWRICSTNLHQNQSHWNRVLRWAFLQNKIWDFCWLGTLKFLNCIYCLQLFWVAFSLP